MAMRGSQVRGTPVNHIVVGAGGEGVKPGTPAGMVGTVHKQYDSDRRGYQSDPNGGTPYHSVAGNPPNARRTVGDHPTHGVVHSESGIDMSDHQQSVGRGTVLDDGSHDYVDGWETTERTPTMDSPVPTDAPVFDTRTIREEDIAHLGVGKGGAENARAGILECNGVMSRGMIGTTGRDRPEHEVLEENAERAESETPPTAPHERIVRQRD